MLVSSSINIKQVHQDKKHNKVAISEHFQKLFSFFLFLMSVCLFVSLFVVKSMVMEANISDNIYLVKWLLLLQIMFNNQKLPAGPRFSGSVSDLKF